MVTRVLESAGFLTYSAENGAAGLESFVRHATEIALVITDVVMPVMSGVAMAEQIMELHPTAKIIVMSGYSDAALEIRARKSFPFIRKPFKAVDFLNAIGAVLRQGRD